ncbi:MAG: NYN domain-containing protein [Acidimicrobiia bacterium]|nr:NYN domain-containing protein [Acidimicrobiia bacterium]
MALVMSNDGDLLTPVQMAERAGITVITVNPHQLRNQPRHLFGTDKRTLSRRLLARSQLPDPVYDAQGGQIRNPQEWA